MRVSRKISIYRAQRSQQGCSLSLGMLRLAEPPTGRARLRSCLESPRNPITPIETSRVSTLHPGLYKNLREGARRVIGATAKPLYPIDGKAKGLDRRNPRPPSSREGDRPQAVEGVRRRWKAFAGGGRRKKPRREGIPLGGGSSCHGQQLGGLGAKPPTSGCTKGYRCALLAGNERVWDRDIRSCILNRPRERGFDGLQTLTVVKAGAACYFF